MKNIILVSLLLLASTAFADQRVVTLRLFGVQSNYATVAEVGSWMTRNVRAGDRIGGSLTVVRVGNDWIEVQAPDGLHTLRSGDELALRDRFEKLDEIATYQGKHRFAVGRAALAQARQARGVGARTAVHYAWLQPVLKLTNVDAGGVLAQLGFENGDLILAVDGANASRLTADQLAQSLETAVQAVRVKMARNGVIWESVYDMN